MFFAQAVRCPNMGRLSANAIRPDVAAAFCREVEFVPPVTYILANTLLAHTVVGSGVDEVDAFIEYHVEDPLGHVVIYF